MTQPATHQIRLAGPWEFRLNDHSEWLRCALPFSAATADESSARDDAADAWTLRRRFHRPTGLDTETQVMIQLCGSCRFASLHLNGQPVPANPLADTELRQDSAVDKFFSTFSVSGLLEGFNTLELRPPSGEMSSAICVDAVHLLISESGHVGFSPDVSGR